MCIIVFGKFEIDIVQSWVPFQDLTFGSMPLVSIYRIIE
jgi:hypothetical protein